jgi:hypothetical protein
MKTSLQVLSARFGALSLNNPYGKAHFIAKEDKAHAYSCKRQENRACSADIAAQQEICFML